MLIGKDWLQETPSKVFVCKAPICSTIMKLISFSSYCIGCPVREKSCNSSSEVPDENNILSIETARDIKECAG